VLLASLFVAQGLSVPSTNLDPKTPVLEAIVPSTTSADSLESTDPQVLVAWGGKKKFGCDDNAVGLLPQQVGSAAVISEPSAPVNVPMPEAAIVSTSTTPVDASSLASSMSSTKVDSKPTDSVIAALTPKAGDESVNLVQWGGKKKLSPGDVDFPCGDQVVLVQWGGKKKNLSEGEVPEVQWGGKKKLSPGDADFPCGEENKTIVNDQVVLVQWGGKKKNLSEGEVPEVQWGGKKKTQENNLATLVD